MRANADALAARADEKSREGTWRMVLTRIRYARIPRATRDALTRMARGLAVDDRLDFKAASAILNVVYLHEMSPKTGPKHKADAAGRAKSEDDEVAEIYSIRAQRRRQREQLDRLGSMFSAKV